MARFIPDDVLEQIRGRADIVEVISSYVPQLKKLGNTWKACCPFHQEKTPSFTVNPARQAFYCFGCQKGGDVFKFVAEMEKFDFPGAAELLARKYNVVIPDATPYRQRGAGNVQGASGDANYSLRERLFQLHEKLASWYSKCLKDFPEDPVAQYLSTRNIPLEFVNKFQIGASPDSWDAALNWAKKEGFTEKEIEASGIVTENSKGDRNKFYDRFRNRLMFPIWNEQGRVVAFSARTVLPNQSGGKYVNSPESAIFKKSRILYALHFARTAIHEKGYAVLCEGQLDVIAMHRAGCTSAVAPQGTAFGEEQASILKRYTDTVYLALDNDEAGNKAIFKDASILLPMGLSLKVVRYSNAKDADEVLTSQGEDALRSAVENAIDFFEFAFRCTAAENDLATPSAKTAAASAMIDQILLLDNIVARDSYLIWLAGKLDISAESLRMELQRRLDKATSDAARQEFYARQRVIVRSESDEAKTGEQKDIPKSRKNPKLKEALKGLFEVIVNNKEFTEHAESEILPEMLDDSPISMAIEIVMRTKYDGEWEEAGGKILAHYTQKDLSCPEVAAILALDGEQLPKNDVMRKQFEDCLKAIKEIYYMEEGQHLQELYANTPPGDERDDIIRRFTEITRLRVALSNKKSSKGETPL